MSCLMLSRLKAVVGINDPALDTGFLIRESMEDFEKRAESAVTQADLETFNENPLLYIKQKQGMAERKEELWRDVAHNAVRMVFFQGIDAFRHAYEVCPVKDDKGNSVSRSSFDFSRWSEEQSKIPLTAEEAIRIESLVDSVRKQTLATDLLVEGIGETTVMGELESMRCVARVPWFHPEYGVVAMLFSSYAIEWASSYRLKATAREAAFAAALIERHTGKHTPVHVIAVETDQPQRCAVWRMAWFTLIETHRRHARLLRKLRKARQRNMWPGGFEKVRQLDWAFRLI